MANRGRGEVEQSQPWPWQILASAGLLAASLLLFWPGVAPFDAVDQYRQVLSGVYYDWHPPAMARLWRLLHPLLPGAAPMLIVQMAGYWLGLGLLAQGARGARGWAILAVGAFPPLLGWQGVVLKDGQMVAALTLACGLIGCWRLRGRPTPWPALLAAGLCIAYATLVRANAVFATVPLAALLLPPTRPRMAKAAAVLLAIPTLLAASGAFNHTVFAARDSGAQRIEAIWDLAAIAVRTGDTTDVSPGELAALKTARCIKPLFWDPLGEVPACEAAIDRLTRRPPGALYLDLAKAAARHPLAYLGHRLAHLNSTERWLVSFHWPFGGVSQRSESNSLGLTDPWTHVASRWQTLAGALTEWPVGWPIVWVTLGAFGVWIALDSPAAAPRRLALALFGSALCLEASFAVVSISSELRYHLWPILAVALGWAVVLQPKVVARHARLMLAILGLVILAALIARAILPPPAGGYEAWLTA